MHKYQIQDDIGEGAFGKVYLATCTTNPSKKYAIKELKQKSDYKRELAINKLISEHQIEGAPKLITSFIENESKRKLLVFEFAGPSLFQ